MSDTNQTPFIRYIKAFGIGILGGALVIALLFVVCALLVTKLSIPASAIILMVAVCSAIGAFVCGFLSAKIIHTKGVVMGLIAGALMLVVLMLASLIFSGRFAVENWLTKTVVVLVSAALGGILGVNTKK